MRVIYFRDRRGREPVLEYLERLRRDGEQGLLPAYRRALELLADEGPAAGMPHVRMINPRARLYELRVRDHRVAFIVDGDTAVLLHAWRKRSQRLDRIEESRALDRAADWYS